MVDALMRITLRNLNMFPAKHGISSIFSPNVLMKQPPIDYNKHLKYLFGEYVQGHLDRIQTNDTIERTIDAIYLYPSEQKRGGHVIMNLNTGKHITRAWVTSILMPNSIKEKDEQLAFNQGITEIKFYNPKTKLNLPNTDWLAGVDYDETNAEDED